MPAICALNPTTQARVKCATVESGGHYSIAGLPAGTYAVSFAVDWVEEGLDLHPDGYVRRYWQEVPSFGEATLLAGTGERFSTKSTPSDQRRRSLPELRSPERVPAAALLRRNLLCRQRHRSDDDAASGEPTPGPWHGAHGARRAFAT